MKGSNESNEQRRFPRAVYAFARGACRGTSDVGEVKFATVRYRKNAEEAV